MVAELSLLGVSTMLVWKLQMATRQKYTVVSGFAARLAIAIPLVLRLVSLHDHIDSQRFTSAFTIPAVWAQVELHLCLICATIPCLRIFLKSFNTGYYGMDVGQVDPTATVMATKGGSYALSDLRSDGSATASRTQRFGKSARDRVASPGMTTSRVTAQDHGEDGDDAMSDRSDKRIFVRQTVNVLSLIHI